MGRPLAFGLLALGAGAIAGAVLEGQRGSRATQLPLPLTYPKLATDSRGRPLSDAFWRWFGESDAVDDQGRPLVLYHGSDEAFDAFEVQRTSYGYFFAPDRATAAYYGPHVYAVYLKAENIADLNDEATFEKVAREAVDSDTLERHTMTDWGWSPVDSRALRKQLAIEIAEALALEAAHKRTSRLWAWWRATIKDLTLSKEERRDMLAADRTAIAETVEYERWDEDDAVIEAFWKVAPEVRRRAFDRAYPLLNADIEQARRSYGSQEFYMNEQDNFLHAAENLGYDAVIMADPSSTGESISWVMFDPKRIKSVKNQGTFDPKDARMSFNRAPRKSRG